MRNFLAALLCFACLAFATWRLNVVGNIAGRLRFMIHGPVALATPTPVKVYAGGSGMVRVVAPAGAHVPVQNSEGHSPRTDDPKFGTYRDPIIDEIDALHQDTITRFALHDFVGLDALTDDFRAKRARFGNGVWKISEFYEGLEMDAKVDDPGWQARLTALRDWQKARPLSITARVALAETLTDYAWKARGNGFAGKVTQDGWRLFEQRLAEAWTVLKDARALPAKDPCWWFETQIVALGQDWPHAEYDKLFNEAVAFEPEFWRYYTKKAIYLMPRWSGQPGDWERFAEQTLRVPGGLGAETYGRIVFAVDEAQQHLFQETQARWDLTKVSFDKMRERYPDSTEVLAHYAMLAARARDPQACRVLLDTLGDRVDLRTWRTKDRYLQYYHYGHPETR